MAKAAVKRVAQAEIRAAKSFLERRGLKELDKGFSETLKVLARELSGGNV